MMYEKIRETHQQQQLWSRGVVMAWWIFQGATGTPSRQDPLWFHTNRLAVCAAVVSLIGYRVNLFGVFWGALHS